MQLVFNVNVLKLANYKRRDIPFLMLRRSINKCQNMVYKMQALIRYQIRPLIMLDLYNTHV